MNVDEVERARAIVTAADNERRDRALAERRQYQEGRALVRFMLGELVWWRHPHELYFYEDDDCGRPPTMYMRLRCRCQRPEDYVQPYYDTFWSYRLDDGETLTEVLAAVGEHAETGR